MMAAIFLTACGSKDVSDVVRDLDHKVSKLKSYQGSGTMLLHTGGQPQEYQVEVWYQDPHFYRIALTNADNSITQIVLRNDDGVFVLTPHLNKSFRFQSNWPEGQGQVYLYQTLVDSILQDENRMFVIDEEKDAYVFDVAANYENSSLVRQKIWLDRKDYAPKLIEVNNENSNVIVSVEFTSFKFDPSFSAEDFDMKRNMTAAALPHSLPVLVNQLENEGESATDGHFGVIVPSYIPEGTALKEVRDVEWGGEPASLLHFTGETYSFSLLESRPQSQNVWIEHGELVDLGYTIGVLIGQQEKTLRWTNEGVSYRLSSANLPVEEMIQIAISVQGQSGK